MADDRLSPLLLKKVQEAYELLEKSYSSGRELAHEAAHCFEAALAEAGEDAEENLIALILEGRAQALHAAGDLPSLEAAVKCYEEAVLHLHNAGEVLRIPLVVSGYQACCRDLALLQPAVALDMVQKGLTAGQEALSLALSLHDGRSVALLSQTTADLCCVMADLDPEMRREHIEVALEMYERAELFWEEQAGYETPEGKIIAQLGMAEAYIKLGKNLDSALQFLDQAREFYENTQPSSYQLGQVFVLYGRLFATQGESDKADEYARKAREIFSRLGFSRTG